MICHSGPVFQQGHASIWEVWPTVPPICCDDMKNFRFVSSFFFDDLQVGGGFSWIFLGMLVKDFASSPWTLKELFQEWHMVAYEAKLLLLMGFFDRTDLGGSGVKTQKNYKLDLLFWRKGGRYTKHIWTYSHIHTELYIMYMERCILIFLYIFGRSSHL